MRLARLLLLAVIVLALYSGPCLALQKLGTKTYETYFDFQEGTFRRCMTEPSTRPYIRLEDPEELYIPVLWVPSSDGTVSRIDIDTGRELGRYRVGPLSPNPDPSRTAVDRNGSCWVGCRGTGAVVKIGVTELGKDIGWKDHNGDGILQTCVDSSGNGKFELSEVLPFGADEAVMHEVTLGVDGFERRWMPGDPEAYNGYSWVGTRGLAVDDANNLWAGTYGGYFYYINGDTGVIAPKLAVPDHGSYGAVLDMNGVLWSVDHARTEVMKFNPATLERTDIPVYGAYGITVNHEDGVVLVTRYDTDDVVRIPIDGTTPEVIDISGANGPKGIVCTENGDIWIANEPGGYITHYPKTGGEPIGDPPQIMPTGDGAGDPNPIMTFPTGMTIDANGKIWTCDRYDTFIHRIDPDTDRVDGSWTIPDSIGHYTYSDQTGLVSNNPDHRIGTWTVVWDSGGSGPVHWGVLDWEGVEDGELTFLKVKVRSSVGTPYNWSEWEEVQKNVPLQTTPDGRFIQIQVTLESLCRYISPTLDLLEVSYTNDFIVTPASVTVPEGGTASVQVKLAADPQQEITAQITRSSGDTDLYLQSASSMTFNSSNWNQYQTMTVGALEDDDWHGDSAVFQIANGLIGQRNVGARAQENDGPVFLQMWGTPGIGDTQFYQPWDVCADSSDNIYVADSGNNRIQKFSANGSFIGKWGQYGDGLGGFSAPSGVTAGPGNTILVADTQNGRVQVFDSDGSDARYLDGPDGMNGPYGVEVDGTGAVWVAETWAHRVRKYGYDSVTGTWSLLFTKGDEYGAGSYEFAYPEAIALDSSDTAYVADTDNSRIQILSTSGSFAGRFGSPGTNPGQLSYPRGICVSPLDDLYVSDTYNHRIGVFYGGEYQLGWGSYGSGPGQFNYPSGICCDSAGNIYVADTENSRIQKFGVRLGSVQSYVNDTWVGFGPVAVTATFPAQSRTYVETTDSVAGIGVETTEAFPVGTLVNVRGQVKTDGNGEKYVSTIGGFIRATYGTHAVEPLGMRNDWIGGATQGGTPIAGGFGLPNVGLLVQTWGRVEYLGADYFYINDGSNLWDGSGRLGVRIQTTDIPAWLTVGKYVRVTGVSSKKAVYSGSIARVVKPRAQSDIVEITSWDTYRLDLYAGCNYVGLPAIPNPYDPETVFQACQDRDPFGLNGNLSRQSSRYGNWLYYDGCNPSIGDVLLSEGYRLQIPGTPGPTVLTQQCYSGTPAVGDQWISLPGGRFIANPFDHDVLWADCRFTDGIVLKTPAEAVAAGWLSGTVKHIDGPTQVLVSEQITDVGRYFVRRQGYTMTTNKANLALIVPN